MWSTRRKGLNNEHPHSYKAARSPRAAPSSASQTGVPSTRRRESHNYLLDFLQQLLLFTVPLINLSFKKLMPCHAARRAMISRSCCRFRCVLQDFQVAKKSLELPSSKNESTRSFLSGFDGIVKIVRKETLLYHR